MAQGKSGPTSSSGRSGGSRASAAKVSGSKASGAKVSTSKGSASKGSASKLPGTSGSRPPSRGKGKSIVNQKQTPWGLIVTTVVVVLFAVGVVVAVISSSGSDSGKTDSASRGGQSVDASDPYRQPELAAAKAIKGVTYRVEAQHNHVTGTVNYDSTPPVGGNHDGYWADCAGTVYPKAIANENAVHMLEHGAIWITYNADEVTGAQLAELRQYVAGQDRMALSPYPGLSSPISLQAWGYQLKVDKASDPRIAEFINTLKYNQKTTPEYGATCSQPTFKANPSTFGNPKNGP